MLAIAHSQLLAQVWGIALPHCLKRGAIRFLIIAIIAPSSLRFMGSNVQAQASAKRAKVSAVLLCLL